MAVSHLQALTKITGRRGLGWIDERQRSPKALDDWSGVLLSKVTTQSNPAVQEFDYDMLSKIYICNDMVWTCINLVSSTAALGQLKVRSKGEDATYLLDHPVQTVLDFPNSSMTQFDLIQAYVTHQLLFGHVTMLLLRRDMCPVCPVCEDNGMGEECTHRLLFDSESPVQQIMPIHPDNIEKRYIESLQKEYFFYIPNGKDGKRFPIHPNNILTDPFYNPDIDWYGVSPTHMLQRWLNLDTSMTQQLNDYFRNGAIPSMIVSLKPGTNFTYEDEPSTLVTKMKESWIKQFSGASKQQKTPAFVYGDINVERVQENVNETIGKNIYYEIQNRVCATYGVPPTLYEMGLRYGAQRASAEQHERNFYNNTISKILTRLKLKINQLVVSSYNDPNIEVVWDLSNMGVASFLLEAKDKRIQEHWKLGLLKRNDAQILLGYEPDTSELGDDYYRLTVMGDGNSQASNQLQDNNLTPASDNE